MKIRNYIKWEYLFLLPPIVILIFLYESSFSTISIDIWYFIVPLIVMIFIFVLQSIQRKKDKKDTEITFIESEGTFILNWPGHYIPNLKLFKNEKSIDNKCILYQFTIINSGEKDIDKTLFKKPLKIEFNHKYKWKSIEVKSDNDIGVKYSLQNHSKPFLYRELFH